MSWIKRLRHWFRFNLWYFGKPPWDTGVTPPELHEFISQHPAGRALDMGCGTGTNVITLAKAGWQVIGVDFVPKAVQTAQARITQAGLSGQAQVMRADVSRLEDIHGPFDLILDIGCYHGLPLEARTGYLRNIDRLLAQGGFWLIYTRCRPESVEAIGISEMHIRRLKENWELVKRADGFDRLDIPAAWLWFYNGKVEPDVQSASL
jgi:SAM-dependent methyltransferase